MHSLDVMDMGFHCVLLGGLGLVQISTGSVLFFCLALEPATSPGSPGYFQWTMLFRKQDLSPGVLAALGPSRFSTTKALLTNVTWEVRPRATYGVARSRFQTGSKAGSPRGICHFGLTGICSSFFRQRLPWLLLGNSLSAV